MVRSRHQKDPTPPTRYAWSPSTPESDIGIVKFGDGVRRTRVETFDLGVRRWSR